MGSPSPRLLGLLWWGVAAPPADPLARQRVDESEGGSGPTSPDPGAAGASPAGDGLAQLVADTDADGIVDLTVTLADVDPEPGYEVAHLAADTDADGLVDVTVALADVDVDPGYDVAQLTADTDADGLVDGTITWIDHRNQPDSAPPDISEPDDVDL